MTGSSVVYGKCGLRLEEHERFQLEFEATTIVCSDTIYWFLNTPRYGCKHAFNIYRPGVSESDSLTVTGTHFLTPPGLADARLSYRVCVCVRPSCGIDVPFLTRRCFIWEQCEPLTPLGDSSIHSCGEIGPPFPNCLFRVMVKGMSAGREHYWAWPICSQMEYTLCHSTNLCNWLRFGLQPLWLRFFLFFFLTERQWNLKMHEDGRCLLWIDMNFGTFWL